MAKELFVSYDSGSAVYAVGRIAKGENVGKWGDISTGTLVDFVGADWSKYAITMTELGSTGLFEGDMPDLFDADREVDIVYYLQSGASPAQTDAKITQELFELSDLWFPSRTPYKSKDPTSGSASSNVTIQDPNTPANKAAVDSGGQLHVTNYDSFGDEGVVLTGRWGSGVGEIDNLRMDSSTNSFQTVSYAHHEIHSGAHFIARGYATIARNTAKEYLIVTPAGTVYAHMITGFDLSTSTTIGEWFEGVTTTDDGTLLLERNRNRNVADNNTTLIYEDPTVTDGAVAGNLLQSGIFGAGRGSIGGGARDNEEIMLKPSTKYLIRFTEQNLSDVNLNFFADWYEHEDKH